MKRPVIIRKEIDPIIGWNKCSAFNFIKNGKEADIALVNRLGKNYFKVAVKLDYFKEVNEPELYHHLKSLNTFKYYGSVRKIRAIRLIPSDANEINKNSAYIIFDVDYNVKF